MSTKHKVVISSDATTIIIGGDKRKQTEPTYAIIKFPGGSVEVARNADGSYWLHGGRTPARQAWEEEPCGVIIESRIDYETPKSEGPRNLGPDVEHFAIRIGVAP